MKLMTLELTPEESQEVKEGYCSPGGDSVNAPKYAPGANFYLSDDMMRKIGMANLPAVGARMMMWAEVTVTGVSRREDQKETHQTVDMQMTALALEPQVDEEKHASMFPSMASGSAVKA